MKRKIIKLLLILFVVATVVYLLAYQPGILVLEFIGISKLPAGTVISWVGIIAYCLFFVFVFPKQTKSAFERFLYQILLLNLFVSMLWGVISFFISGNWANNFSGINEYETWLYFTASILLVPFVSYLLLLFYKVYLRIK